MSIDKLRAAATQWAETLPLPYKIQHIEDGSYTAEHADRHTAAIVDIMAHFANAAVRAEREVCANECDRFASYLDSQLYSRERDIIKGLANVLRSIGKAHKEDDERTI